MKIHSGNGSFSARTTTRACPRKLSESWATFDLSGWIVRTTWSFTGRGRNAPERFFWVTVKTAVKPEAAAGMVRSALNKLDPGLPIIQPNTMNEIVDQSLGQRRLTMTLLGVFAGIALVLAMVGIYGAVAYTVEQRTGEIGVRMALGAQTADVLRLVVKQGMTPVIIGLLIGLGAALALGRLLTAQLYEVSANNPALLAATSVTLAVVALLACLIPARRASLVNPIEALRTE